MWDRIKRAEPFADSLAVLPLEAAKLHLRYEDDDQDEAIKGYIAAAAEKIDGPDGFGVSLVPAQWTLTLDRLPPLFQFPLGPVTSVDSITYRGETVDPGNYEYDTDMDPLFIRSATGWGVENRSGLGAVKVNVTAGYTTPPADLVQLVRFMVGHYFENRESVVLDVSAIPLPMGADDIIAKYRRGVAY